MRTKWNVIPAALPGLLDFRAAGGAECAAWGSAHCSLRWTEPAPSTETLRPHDERRRLTPARVDAGREIAGGCCLGRHARGRGRGGRLCGDLRERVVPRLRDQWRHAAP